MTRTTAADRNGEELSEWPSESFAEQLVGDAAFGQFFAATLKRQPAGRFGSLGERDRAENQPDSDDKPPPPDQAAGQDPANHQRSISMRDNRFAFVGTGAEAG
ncbi:MAG: hypothetical protein R2882_00385 [Gemmatimonadales bacterium]